MKAGELVLSMAIGIPLAMGCSGAVRELPPYGEAVFHVDTDLRGTPLATRLRVDLYSESGRWFESRDIGRSDSRSWPASFGVYSDDVSRPRRVLVRIRAYPEGVTRAYRGERFSAREPYVAPRPFESLSELCANAPSLPLGSQITMRRGGRAITEVRAQSTCNSTNLAGSVAATVTIAEEGTYRFSVADARPYEAEATLFLRSQCGDPSTQIACSAVRDTLPVSSGHLPRFDVELTPGTYTLMSGGELADWPADLTLEALSIDRPVTLPPRADDDAGTGASVATMAPRLRPLNGSDVDGSPNIEPLPSATVDRLVAVELAPGVRGVVPVTLRAACAGTMARLGADPRVPSLDGAETCIDTDGVRVPLVTTALVAAHDASTDPSPGPNLTLGEPCDSGRADDGVVCQPPGAFLFGSRAVESGFGTVAQSGPERVAVVSRFFLDRTEVSVGRLRAALGRGLVIPEGGLYVNDGDYGTWSGARNEDIETFCTFSSQPRTHEQFPVNCVAWSFARAFCRFEGGDLPTEAQWEYAAANAGRFHKTRFPWGNDLPSCDRATFGRLEATDGECLELRGPGALGPSSVSAHAGEDGAPGDRTPLGVVGLAGNVAEWMLDAADSFGSRCWVGAPLRDPTCLDDNAPLRVVRGGGWTDAAIPVVHRVFMMGALPATGRHFLSTRLPHIGFRCAYPQRPAR